MSDWQVAMHIHRSMGMQAFGQSFFGRLALQVPKLTIGYLIAMETFKAMSNYNKN